MMLASVVVQVIQQFNVLSDKAKSQAPVGLHRHGMKACPVTAEAMQAPGRAGQVLRASCHIQRRQQLAQPGGMDGLYAPGTAHRKETLKALMPERQDHTL